MFTLFELEVHHLIELFEVVTESYYMAYNRNAPEYILELVSRNRKEVTASLGVINEK